MHTLLLSVTTQKTWILNLNNVEASCLITDTTYISAAQDCIQWKSVQWKCRVFAFCLEFIVILLWKLLLKSMCYIVISDVTVYHSIYRSSFLEFWFTYILFMVFSFCDCIIRGSSKCGEKFAVCYIGGLFRMLIGKLCGRPMRKQRMKFRCPSRQHFLHCLSQHTDVSQAVAMCVMRNLTLPLYGWDRGVH